MKWTTEKAKGSTCNDGGSLQRAELRKRINCNPSWKKGRQVKGESRQPVLSLYQTPTCCKKTSLSSWERHIFRPSQQSYFLEKKKKKRKEEFSGKCVPLRLLTGEQSIVADLWNAELSTRHELWVPALNNQVRKNSALTSTYSIILV